MVSENIHTHPTTEVQSHVAALSNSENPSPGLPKKGKWQEGSLPSFSFSWGGGGGMWIHIG